MKKLVSSFGIGTIISKTIDTILITNKINQNNL